MLDQHGGFVLQQSLPSRMFFPMTVRTEQKAFIQFGLDLFENSVLGISKGEIFADCIDVMELQASYVAVVTAVTATAAFIFNRHTL
ncbi:MAG: hypothetical protein V4671_02795 [Armatimonadota bacterium]